MAQSYLFINLLAKRWSSRVEVKITTTCRVTLISKGKGSVLPVIQTIYCSRSPATDTNIGWALAV